MSPSSQKYKKEYAFELVKIARGDLISAIELSKSNLGRTENVIYLAQQSIEKSIKAVICFIGQPIVHTHDLDVLTHSLPANQKPPESHRLGALNQYATIRRYEEGYEVLTSEDIKLVIDLGNKILMWAEALIK